MKSDNSELCVNIRCGDIATDDQWHKSCYIFNKERLLEDINKRITKNIQKITIVCAFHYGSDEIDNRFFFTKENYDLNLNYMSSILTSLKKVLKSLLIYSVLSLMT